MPVIIPFQSGDVSKIYGKAYSEVFTSPTGVHDGMASVGPAYTAVVDNKIIGCAGVVLMWEGTGHAWAVFGELFPKYSVFMSKAVRKILYNIIRDNGLARVETLVEATSERNMAWARFLGFKHEGTLVNYYRGIDFEMVAIT